MLPLVSVITPTWQRHGTLFGRCLPSVQQQRYRPWEHLVVSDGPDPVLRRDLATWRGADGADGKHVQFRELPEHDPGVRWGVRARLLALELASGEYVAYLDDDDAWRPDHLSVLVGTLDGHPEAAFGWTRMAVHHRGALIGVLGGELSYGRVATSSIFHRRELAAPWRDAAMPDQALVEGWLASGAGYVAAGEVTADYYRERPVQEPAAVLTREDYQAWRG